MAEEQVMSQTLVFDGNREKLAKIVTKRIKSTELDLRNKLLYRQKAEFCRLFAYLCGRYFKLNNPDLRDLLNVTDSEKLLIILESEVFKIAKRRYKITKYIGWLIMIIFDHIYIPKPLQNKYMYNFRFYSFRYCRLRRKLMEIHGEEFFPFDILKQVLIYCGYFLTER